MPDLCTVTVSLEDLGLAPIAGARLVVRPLVDSLVAAGKIIPGGSVEDATDAAGSSRISTPTPIP